MDTSLWIAVATVAAVVLLTPAIVSSFLRDVAAGEIRLVSWLNGKLKIYRGPCKAMVVPVLTVSRRHPRPGHQRRHRDHRPDGGPRPRRRARAGQGHRQGLGHRQRRRGRRDGEHRGQQVLLEAARRAAQHPHRRALVCRAPRDQPARATTSSSTRARRRAHDPATLDSGEDDELAVIIKEACSRELLDLGLSFNSLNIKAVLSEVADARRREAAARAKASADVVQAQEEQRARIAQLEAAAEDQRPGARAQDADRVQRRRHRPGRGRAAGGGLRSSAQAELAADADHAGQRRRRAERDRARRPRVAPRRRASVRWPRPRPRRSG